LGIIGLGNIGQKVARIASAFSMRILGVNKSKKPVPGIELVDINRLCKDSDIITVCIPLADDTRNMLSTKEISLMKDGVILVNTSRDQITDKSAVLKALESGKIFGFGIETEIMKPIAPEDPYLSHPRIIITPHNAFNTEEEETKSFRIAIDNINNFINGQPQNVVNS
jgi:phosphoglycerate dehydrogenase-like enzyme